MSRKFFTLLFAGVVSVAVAGFGLPAIGGSGCGSDTCDGCHDPCHNSCDTDCDCDNDCDD